MEWTRRAFVKGGGLTLLSLSLGGAPPFLRRAAGAAGSPPLQGRRKVLVALFQRGAMDGLMAVTPIHDPALAKARPNLFMSLRDAENGLTDLDGRFALHPSFAPLVPLYREGRLAVVHGVGSVHKTRSHFDAQDYMEAGTPGMKSTPSGWLNRAAGLLGGRGSPARSVALADKLPRSLYGDRPAIAVEDLQSFGVRVPDDQRVSERLQAGFASMYAASGRMLARRVGRESFEAIEVLKKTDWSGYRPANGAAYPDSVLGRRMRQVAQLVKAEVGLEVAFTETGGWDTHVRQGTAAGSFADRAADLSRALAAFWTDLGPYQDDVVLLTMTEFGRTVEQNGSLGTDHGRGSCLFVLGNGVDGGRVHGTVPERLVKDALEDGRDLPVTTDFRSVFAEVAGKHLGISRSDDGVVFPGWDGPRRRLMRT